MILSNLFTIFRLLLAMSAYIIMPDIARKPNVAIVLANFTNAVFWFCPNLPGCYSERAASARESSSTKLHIRINWTAADGPLKWLPPTQMKVIPGCQSKTPVAQMHFASEPPLSQGSHTLNGQ